MSSQGVLVVPVATAHVLVNCICNISHGLLTHGQNNCILVGAVHRVPAVARV